MAGVGAVTATATLVPSGFGWSNDFLSSDLYQVNSSAVVSTYALDPATLLPIAAQNLRQGIMATIPIQSDRPDIAAPVTASVVMTGSISSSVSIRNIFPGDATFTLTQPSGFSTPATRQRLIWRVAKVRLTFYVPAVGVNTQVQVALSNLPATSQARVATLKSSDPNKVVLSSDPTVLGSGTLSINAGMPFYVQALDSRGTVYLTAMLDGFADTTVPVQLSGTGILLSVDSGGGSLVNETGVYTTLFSSTTKIALDLELVDPDTGRSGSLAGNLALLPGIDPAVVLQTTNPAVGVIQGSPIRLDQRVNGRVLVDFQPVALGDTEISAVPPPGFTVPVTNLVAQNGRILFHVTLPGWDVGQQKIPPLGKDTALPINLSLAENVQPFATDLTIALQTSDPSKLLVSGDPATAGLPALSMTLLAGRRLAGTFYVHALDHQGTARLTITAPGFADTSFEVTLTDLFFGIQFPFYPSPTRIVLQGGPATGTIYFGTAYGGGAIIRPGASIGVHIDSSNPAVLSVDTPDVTLAGGASSGQFTVRPLQLGHATVSLAGAQGFGSTPYQVPGSINVSVEAMKLNINVANFQIGKDQQSVATFSTEPLPKPVQNVIYTIVSSDPSLLIVSDTATTPGSAQVTLPAGSNQAYLQALSNSGTATVTVSSPGAQPATGSLQFTPSGVVFVSTSNLSLQTNGPPQRVQVQLLRLDPASLQPSICCLDPRPGFNASVTITSSNPSVATVSPAVVQFSGSSPQFVDIKPVSAGTAIISLSVPAGSDTPASGRTITVTVR
jgi:hypothetical protein